MTKKFKNLTLVITLVFVLSGCSIISIKKPAVEKKPGEQNNGQQTKNQNGTEAIVPVTILEKLSAQSKIKKFASLDDLSEFMENSDTTSGYGSWAGGMGSIALDMDEAVMDSSVSRKSVAPMNTMVNNQGLEAGSYDFSKTNVQVEGVDEADIVKTDGKYVYAVSKNNLFIINAFPAEDAEILSKIEFKSRPQDVYINGNNLVVYGRDSEIFKNEEYGRFKRRSSYTYLKVFDISDRKNPKQVRDLDFEGNYFNSRMIGDYVYFVTNNYQYYIDNEPVLPRILDNGVALDNKCVGSEKCFVPDIYYFDMPYQNFNFTTITAVNIVNNDEDVKGEVYLLSGNQNMYVSLNNIYVTYTKYISEYDLEMELMKEIVFPRLSQKDQEKIAKIESVENYILSSNEKKSKITQILERFAASISDEEQENLEEELENEMQKRYEDISKELEKTVIHKIEIKKGDLEYKTFSEVTGHVLNQFSMDEANGYFRIATTKNRVWSRYEEENIESYNNLYVLDENLKQVGALENLAPEERIYSVRFMQNRAYMVTFKQMDPLFVIDLADPKNPKVLGELKIPGYSDYLHPYDENTLIGIGKDTAENEWGGVTTGGLKLSLFDVSDVDNPKEIDKYIMGDRGSDSIALNDHKAFLFSKDKNLLVIPVSIRESLGGNSWGKLSFSGAAVFGVDKNGFTLNGKIDHSDNGRSSESDNWMGYNYYDNTVKRSLYIDDVLYTFSNQYLKMNNLDDLKLLNNLKLQKEKDEDFIIIN